MNTTKTLCRAIEMEPRSADVVAIHAQTNPWLNPKRHHDVDYWPPFSYLTHVFTPMSEASSPPPASPALRRPWWWLHISTCVIALLTAVPFFFLIVPASRRGERYKFVSVYEHGWPMTQGDCMSVSGSIIAVEIRKSRLVVETWGF